MSHLLTIVKQRVKGSQRLSHNLFYLYLKVTFAYQSLWSFGVSRLINLLRNIMVKGDITSFTVSRKSVELSYLGKSFYWNPADRRSLLGIAFSGVYEKAELETLLKFIKPGMRVFDVGANFGLHSVLLADKVGSIGHIYSFEPLKTMYNELRQNIRLNGFEQRVTAENLGLSDKPGTTVIYIAQALGTGATSLRKRWSGKNSRQLCQLTTLDHYIQKTGIGHVDLIKCDVEGAELMVFQGAHRTLGAALPILFFESIDNHASLFGYSTRDLIAYLQNFPYQFYRLDGRYLKRVTSEFGNGNYFAIAQRHKLK